MAQSFSMSDSTSQIPLASSDSIGHRAWLTLGAGTGDNGDASDLEVTCFTANYSFEHLLFTGRYLALSQIIKNTSLTFFDRFEPQEYALLIGTQTVSRFAFASVGVGVGVFKNYYLAGSPPDNGGGGVIVFEDVANSDAGAATRSFIGEYTVLGLALHGSANLTIYGVGIGVTAFANLNPRSQVYVACGSVELGKFF